MAKQTFGEYFASLGVNKYSDAGRAALEVMRIYSDCLPDSVERDETIQRNLSTQLVYPVKAKDLEPLFKIIGGYNGFEPEKAAKEIREFFDDEALVLIGREGSPVVYVKPNTDVWLNRDEHPYCDEFSFDSLRGMFRLWWD